MGKVVFCMQAKTLAPERISPQSRLRSSSRAEVSLQSEKVLRSGQNGICVTQTSNLSDGYIAPQASYGGSTQVQGVGATSAGASQPIGPEILAPMQL